MLTANFYKKRDRMVDECTSTNSLSIQISIISISFLQTKCQTNLRRFLCGQKNVDYVFFLIENCASKKAGKKSCPFWCFDCNIFFKVRLLLHFAKSLRFANFVCFHQIFVLPFVLSKAECLEQGCL